MKKCILNDALGLIIVIPCILVFLILLIFGLEILDDTQNEIIITLVFGGFLILGIIIFIGWFELIFFKADEIKSVKIYKRTKISYSEIVRIKECTKLNVGIHTAAKVWEICDCNERYINVMKIPIFNKKRKRLIDEVKQKAFNAEIQNIQENIK